MIETCPKKVMLLGLFGLGLVTVVVLIVESKYASESVSGLSKSHRSKQFPTENNSTCWLHQEYSVVTECHPCTDFEIKSKSIGVCIHTNFKEVLKCKNNEIVTRSCDRVAYLEERAYWKFVLWSFFIAFPSGLLVMFRTRSLNHKARLKTQRQLANGLL